MTATTHRERGRTNARVELGRYSTSADGERVVYGQRVLGVVAFLPRSRVVVAVLTGA